MGEPGFWDRPEQARSVIAQVKAFKAQTEPLSQAMRRLEEARLAYQMWRESHDPELLAEADEGLFQLTRHMHAVERQMLLSGRHDHRNCFLTITAGVGGTEANDWCEMLLRMYLYYIERMGWEVEEVDKTYGTEAGLDSVTLHVKGPYAFGYLSCERGTHRLARVSPFNAQGKRQTSFATVDVVPEFEDAEVEIPEKDLQIVPFVRASGPGGQNVNKVASAVRITHLPTGIQVVASTHRDQLQNKRQALAVLKARLEALEEEKRQREIAAATGGAVERGWGTQIRSYVLYDNRVKDHRTGYEVMDPDAVLRGDIEGFIEAELKRRRAEREALPARS